ncbi:MAG: polyprenyl synthetase family protein [Pseudomonadota bacterium]
MQVLRYVAGVSGNHFLSLLKDDLERIEDAIVQNLSSHVPFISNVSRYILFSGGKRVRPLLMILAARMCGYTGDHEYGLSAIFEYLHAATLLHDDVVDNAEIRRGKAPAKDVYGNQAVILVGDFLYSKSLLISTLQGDIRIMEPLLEATTLMAEGEVLQLLNEENLEIGEEEYMQVIHRKTAVLMAAACQVGAILGSVSREKEAAMRAYGENIGMSFQLTDDILDYTGSVGEFGKKVGNDFKEGKVTLPLIHALRRSNQNDLKRIREIFLRKRIKQAEFIEAKDLIEKYGGFEYTRRLAQNASNKAKDDLALFPPSPTKEILSAIADYIVERRK